MKAKLTILVWPNASDIEEMLLTIIGHMLKQRAFGGNNAENLAFENWNNAKAWMKSVLFLCIATS